MNINGLLFFCFLRCSFLCLLGFPLAVFAQSGSTADGFVYATASGAVTITGYTGSGGAITIPSNFGGIPVTSIGNSAFQNKISISSLTIPSSVTSIGVAAFAGCTGLTTLSFAAPSSLRSISDNAFNGCTGLTGSLTIPSGVTSIGTAAFAGCNGLTGNLTLSNSLTSIGGYAFWNCTGITGSLTIPGSVISVGVYAFQFCRKLTGLVFASPSSLTSIGTSAFDNCTGLTGSLTIPSSVTTINGLAFFGCSGLTSLNFASPSKLSMISNSAFEKCTALTGKLTIPSSVATISRAAFRDCRGLTSLSFASPSKLDIISDDAFSLCTGLTGSVTFPRNLRIIGSTAFQRCDGITRVLFLGRGSPEIRYNAFLYTDNLQKVYYLSSAADFHPRAVEGKTAEVLADPIITAQPASRTVNAGTSVTFEVNDTGFELTYQWQKNGTPIPDATKASYTIDAATPSDAGSYAVVLTNVYGLVTSNTAILIVDSVAIPTSNPSAYLSNVSIRTALTADQMVIVGFSVPGVSKPILLRAAGPVLTQFGLSAAMDDPQLALYQGTTLISSNDNWEDSLAATFSRLGAFPFIAGSRDAALLPALSGGGYTVIATGSGAGVVLVEVYDAGISTAQRFTSLSARNRVGTGANILIAGFSLSGEGKRNLLIRAVGPTLGVFGVPSVLTDPKLEIYQGSTKIGENDNWSSMLSTTFSSVGAFGLTAGSKDAAITVSLPAGGYTVQVSGADGGVGEALVEVYELP